MISTWILCIINLNAKAVDCVLCCECNSCVRHLKTHFCREISFFFPPVYVHSSMILLLTHQLWGRVRVEAFCYIH